LEERGWIEGSFEWSEDECVGAVIGEDDEGDVEEDLKDASFVRYIDEKTHHRSGLSDVVNLYLAEVYTKVDHAQTEKEDTDKAGLKRQALNSQAHHSGNGGAGPEHPDSFSFGKPEGDKSVRGMIATTL